MTKDESLKLALEALETCNWVDDGGYGHAEYDHVSTNKAITAIKEALAQPERSMKVEGPLHVVCQCNKCNTQPEQEPVAWMGQDGQRVTTASNRHDYPDYETRYSIPLYTTPPQRTWVGLTDEDVALIDWELLVTKKDLVKAIEAKLKEKNT